MRFRRRPPVEVSLAEGPWLYRLLAAFVSVVLWPFVKVDTQRLDAAHRYRTAVVVTNHRSYMDVPAALVAFHRLKRYPRTIVASNWFDQPVLGFLLRSTGCIPMDRENPALHLAASRRVLDADIPVLILPEGRLAGEPGDPTSTGPFKTGAARLAQDCGVDVWPLALVGADEVWPADAKLPRLNPFRRRTVMILGAPDLVPIDDDPRASTERLRTQVTELLHEAVELRSIS